MIICVYISYILKTYSGFLEDDGDYYDHSGKPGCSLCVHTIFILFDYINKNGRDGFGEIPNT